MEGRPAFFVDGSVVGPKRPPSCILATDDTSAGSFTGLIAGEKEQTLKGRVVAGHEIPLTARIGTKESNRVGIDKFVERL